MRCVLEKLSTNFLKYLTTQDVIRFCYVSKVIRNLIFKIFDQILFISTGFRSTEQWLNLIKKNCFALIDDIHNAAFFDETFFDYNFDFEENYFRLVRDFRHMSLFSICLHFLRCTRSCDKKKVNYCRICSRVSEKFFMECYAFQSLCLCAYGTYSGMQNLNRVDLDVFLMNAMRWIGYTIHTDDCCHFQVFTYPQELFAAFSSILIRIYLHCTLKSFASLLSSLSLGDEKKIIQITLKHANFFLNKFWHQTNYRFFNELFDKLDRVNTSSCFRNFTNKPKFGPYNVFNYSFTVQYH